MKLLNHFLTALPPRWYSAGYIRRLSSDGHERGAYLPIAIFGIGDSAFLIWKSGCVLMYSQLAIRAA
jgi:hypothetical protein